MPYTRIWKNLKEKIDTSMYDKERSSFLKEYKFYQMHLKLVENQKKILQDKKENIKDGKCIIAMDSKRIRNYVEAREKHREI